MLKFCAKDISRKPAELGISGSVPAKMGNGAGVPNPAASGPWFVTVRVNFPTSPKLVSLITSGLMVNSRSAMLPE
ncbi:MAG: hypothetical protein L3J52_02055 [Proteobacteria bacterium]|nr:hypothetical protein [Pseudomonadota bacterium]